MESEKIAIKNIPALLWGPPAQKLFLYIHGQGGCKEEARTFAEIAQTKGCQVLSIDLPGHGERKTEIENFNPWCVMPELTQVMNYAKQNWQTVSLFAQSIGAYFSMLTFPQEKLEQALFVSPIIDMKYLINRMMGWASVTEEQLKKEKIISTTFGQTLIWDYFEWVQKHPIKIWNTKTAILYGEHDNLIEQNVIENFAAQFNCGLTVMKNGEHWFHTAEEIDFLNEWAASCIK